MIKYLRSLFFPKETVVIGGLYGLGDGAGNPWVNKCDVVRVLDVQNDWVLFRPLAKMIGMGDPLSQSMRKKRFLEIFNPRPENMDPK